MIKAMKITLKILSSLIVALVVLLAVLLVGTRVIGLTPYTVLSGSMEPTYHVGSIIYVKNVAPEDLKLNDPVTFRLSDSIIATHRIIEIHGEGTSELSFRTKGDANEVADGIIPAAAIIGKPVFTVPYLGFVSSFVQKPAGLIIILGLCIAAMLISFAADAFVKKKEVSDANSDTEPNVS